MKKDQSGSSFPLATTKVLIIATQSISFILTIVHDYLMVKHSARYQEATWLSTVIVDYVWSALKMFWIDVFVEPSGIETHDTRKQFV